MKISFDLDKKLDMILCCAKNDKHCDERIYTYYKHRIEDLNLTPLEYEKAIVRLMEVLEI